MKIIREFINSVREEYTTITLEEIFEDNARVIKTCDVEDELKIIGIKEITDTYYDSVEFIGVDNKYYKIQVLI